MQCWRTNTELWHLVKGSLQIKLETKSSPKHSARMCVEKELQECSSSSSIQVAASVEGTGSNRIATDRSKECDFEVNVRHLKKNGPCSLLHLKMGLSLLID